MLAQHVGADGTLVQVDAAGDGVLEARGVQGRAGADDAARVVAGEVPDLRGNHVAGVGDGDDDAPKAGVHQAARPGAGDLGGHKELAVAVAGGLGHVTGGVDHHVAAGEKLVLLAAVDHAAVVRIEAHGVSEVLALALQLLRVDVGEVELVCHALHEQAVCHVRAHVALSDDADLANECHAGSRLLSPRRAGGAQADSSAAT